MWVAVLSVGLGTSVIGAFMTLYADVRVQMSRELRESGANFVIQPADGVETLPEDSVTTMTGLVHEGHVLGAQPFLYDVVEWNGRRMAAAGMRFDAIRTVTPYWQIQEGEPAGAAGMDACLLGKSVAEKLNVQLGEAAMLQSGGRTHSCVITAIVDTGGAEDDQVFLPLPHAQRLFDRPGQVHMVLVNLLAEDVDVDALARKVESAVPGARAHPIRRLRESEGRILGRIRSIVQTVVILITASSLLGLLIALMTMVTERRREMALMTVLGATSRRLNLHFLCEVAVIGLVGGIVGSLLGAAMAERMERTMFGTSMDFHPGLIPFLLVLSMLLSLLGAILPLRQVRKIQPAVLLKGD